MLKYINHKTMGGGDHGWLNSIFHFSFADYYNENNMNFGVLRVVNDDLVQPGYGFESNLEHVPAKAAQVSSFAFRRFCRRTLAEAPS